MYDKLISLENLFISWKEFRCGKQNKTEVQFFERFLEDNIFAVCEELKNQTYHHGEYKTFYIQDPKPRIINKAIVKDRLVHHLIFKKLYSIFNSSFIFHSYASRENKGTHLAVKNLSKCLGKVSKNYTCPAYVLKCDIKKFFASINHKKLLELIENKIFDRNFLWLIEEIVGSFFSPSIEPLRFEKNIWGGGVKRK
ncbi:MAG: reverse transcriptase domain-containing protein [Parcubacteria group bacterium]|jgi:retron-type reverse transcriptase